MVDPDIALQGEGHHQPGGQEAGHVAHVLDTAARELVIQETDVRVRLEHV